MADARGPAAGKLAGAAEHRRRAGRPRLRPASNADVPPREEILDAAAGLFVSQGLAATTTRQIAGRVGIRQASLYYYFAGKDEILLELLTQSVRPSLQVAAMMESRCRGDPAAGLYALALIDVRTLTQRAAQHRHAIPGAGGAGGRVCVVPGGAVAVAGGIRAARPCGSPVRRPG